MGAGEINFGTDGFRGLAYEEVNAKTARQVAEAAANVTGLREWVIVEDTRPINREELREGVLVGLAHDGAEGLVLKKYPTPAGAIIADQIPKQLGGGRKVGVISLTASHNPASDAGIKVFGAGGLKLDDEVTQKIEDMANSIVDRPFKGEIFWINAEYRNMLRNMYTTYILGTVDRDLRHTRFLTGKKIVVDAANGAAYESTAEILGALGANTILINADPKGEINKDSGATDTGSMVRTTKEENADLGLSLDGDADRVILWTPDREIDGDDAMALEVMRMMHLSLNPNGVVATIYSNLGLKRFVNGAGVPFYEVPTAGDRYVLEGMKKYGYLIGGEQSGHILYEQVARDRKGVLAGDGTLTALQILAAEAQIGKPLAELAAQRQQLPHILGSIMLSKGVDSEAVMYHPLVRKVTEQLCAEPNVETFVRESGTKRGQIRILARGLSEGSTKEAWQMLVDAIEHAAEDPTSPSMATTAVKA